jgi:hypothetical protein
MDDKEGGPERLQQAICQLKMMEPEARQKYLNYCELELKYADGWSAQHYKDYLEAAKYV